VPPGAQRHRQGGLPARRAVEPRTSGPLRILVEGYASTWFKGVNEAIAAAGEMREPRHLTVVAPDRTGLRAEGADEVVGPISQRELAERYAQTDVVLKLSQVEGCSARRWRASTAGRPA
jgi:hypothetical protein